MKKDARPRPLLVPPAPRVRHVSATLLAAALAFPAALAETACTDTDPQGTFLGQVAGGPGEGGQGGTAGSTGGAAGAMGAGGTAAGSAGAGGTAGAGAGGASGAGNAGAGGAANAGGGGAAGAGGGGEVIPDGVLKRRADVDPDELGPTFTFDLPDPDPNDWFIALSGVGSRCADFGEPPPCETPTWQLAFVLRVSEQTDGVYQLNGRAGLLETGPAPGQPGECSGGGGGISGEIEVIDLSPGDIVFRLANTKASVDLVDSQFSAADIPELDGREVHATLCPATPPLR
jgi:hypothetical protein